MPGYALGMSELQSVVGPLIVRTFDVGKSQAAKDDELSRGSALLALIVTETDDVTDWIAAGQAMQRVLLTATAAGLRASFLNQPIEISCGSNWHVHSHYKAIHSCCSGSATARARHRRHAARSQTCY